MADPGTETPLVERDVTLDDAPAFRVQESYQSVEIPEVTPTAVGIVKQLDYDGIRHSVTLKRIRFRKEHTRDDFVQILIFFTHDGIFFAADH